MSITFEQLYAVVMLAHSLGYGRENADLEAAQRRYESWNALKTVIIMTMPEGAGCWEYVVR